MPETTNFETFAAAHRASIDQALRSIFKDQTALATSQDAAYADLVTQLSQLSRRGGKRLRPLLCLLAYQAYGGRDRPASRQLAASLELIHMFLLIHDDIIDRDYQRWGGLNISGVYFERYSRTLPAAEALHAAEAQALMGGDICLALANQTLLHTTFSPACKLELQQLLQAALLQALGGEANDMAQSGAAILPTEAEVLAMYRAKTASYSFALPLQAGARAAGATPQSLRKLAVVADHLGVAYQLQDDILGLFGDETQTGKPNTSDLQEAKRTVLLLYALQHTAPSAARRLRRHLGQPVTSQALQEVRMIITDSGARQYVETLANQHLDKAITNITKLAMDDIGRQRLLAFTEMIAQRFR